jgi:D-sedoheptulose 7-phosphate isomerase
MSTETDYVAAHFAASQGVIAAVLADRPILQLLVDIANLWAEQIAGGGKIMLAGNGGSAADAQHIAGELLSRLNFDRPALAGLALTTDTSVLTAIGNDYGYDRVFERQVVGLGRPGDVFVAISTSGRSPNILRALAAARERGLGTVGFTGRSGGQMPPLCDLCLNVPSDSTPLIQQVHIAAAHAICGLVEQRIFGKLSDQG